MRSPQPGVTSRPWGLSAFGHLLPSLGLPLTLQGVAEAVDVLSCLWVQPPTSFSFLTQLGVPHLRRSHLEETLTGEILLRGSLPGEILLGSPACGA